MQLFSSTINASATPAIAVLDQPSSMESYMSMQPQLSAVYQRTTEAKRIATNVYQVRSTLILFYKERSILATPLQISYFWGRSLGVP